MSKGEGGGVSIVFGYHGVPASGAKRQKLAQPIEIDAHLTQKALRDEARAKAGKIKKKAKPKLSKAERKAENEARKLHRKALKKVVVVRQVGGQIKSVQRIGNQRREALIAEREPLRQRWREQLLGRGTDPDQPSG
ncbi:hypothetical protein [Sphingobium sp. MK2]|uniref:hypothetical protein n=1 Tax=Sphingobium sp. MK2 TaxID=3116540 RepID=UPI0032E35A59